MGLSVLNVAYPLAPVGPDSVGGAEQILSRLDEMLTQAGLRSLVVACAGSCTAGTLVATRRFEGPLTDSVRAQAQVEHRAAIVSALRRWTVDVIHMHGIDFHAYVPPPGPPLLVTLHLPPAWYPAHAFRMARPRTYLQCVSASQRRECPPCPALLPEIENGVEIDDEPIGAAPREYAVALGRICPEKGFHLAIDAAKRAGVPLLLAGQVYGYEAHEAYFRDVIEPRLDGSRRFVGPVGGRRKRDLLGGARCLLAPSLVPETSSLVAMEALACGTPVIAFRSGALADIVEHGRTGFLVNNVVEMAEAISAVGRLRAEDCRAAVRTRFSLQRMTEQYLELYRRLATESRAETFQETMACSG